MKKLLSVLLIMLMCSGCNLFDLPKSIWGSSTLHLEEALLENEVYETYQCSFDQCFRSVLDIAAESGLVVFSKSEVKSLIVLMEIPGSVDTTEVGVFFTELSGQRVRVDVVSASSHAQRAGSKIVFSALGERFVQE